jgi:hypothetical protein
MTREEWEKLAEIEGTGGEYLYMSFDERKWLLELVKREARRADVAEAAEDLRSMCSDLDAQLRDVRHLLIVANRLLDRSKKIIYRDHVQSVIPPNEGMQEIVEGEEAGLLFDIDDHQR